MAAGYVRGMVVNVDLPRFDATGGWKERPAFIISTEDSTALALMIFS